MKKNMRKVAALGLCVALGATMLTAWRMCPLARTFTCLIQHTGQIQQILNRMEDLSRSSDLFPNICFLQS